MPIQPYARRVGSIGRVRHKNGSTRKALQTRGIFRTFGKSKNPASEAVRREREEEWR